MDQRPDILVLGGGGRQGDAWMTGLLAGLQDAHGIDFRECDYFVGTSAGSIVAAKLASGHVLRPPVPDADGAGSSGQSPLANWAAHSALAIAAPFASIGIKMATRPAQLARSVVLRGLAPEAPESPDFTAAFPPSRVRFDGRLRVVAVERQSGRRVVFGAPGAPAATVAQALSASCALPLVFAPAVVADREYVDGAVWSPTNADVAPAGRDSRVLILATMASLHGPWNAPLRAACSATMLVEASALKLRGARVRIITPDRNSSVAIGRDLMADAQLDRTRAAGYAQGLSA